MRTKFTFEPIDLSWFPLVEISVDFFEILNLVSETKTASSRFFRTFQSSKIDQKSGFASTGKRLQAVVAAHWSKKWPFYIYKLISNEQNFVRGRIFQLRVSEPKFCQQFYQVDASKETWLVCFSLSVGHSSSLLLLRRLLYHLVPTPPYFTEYRRAPKSCTLTAKPLDQTYNNCHLM